jgi:hypothetical protein
MHWFIKDFNAPVNVRNKSNGAAACSNSSQQDYITKTLLPGNNINIGYLQIYQKYQQKLGEVRTANPTHLLSKAFERNGEKDLKWSTNKDASNTHNLSQYVSILLVPTDRYYNCCEVIIIWPIYSCQLCVILAKMQISESCPQQFSQSGLTTAFVAVYL